MDTISTARLSLVCPKLSDLIKQLDSSLAQEGISIRVVQGLRTWNEQAALYAQGRTAPGKVVTQAPPGHSWHNFGMAVDVVPMPNGQPDWNLGHPAWQRIVALGESLGLTSGSKFSHPDWPHLQLTGKFPVSPTDEVRQLFRDAGMEAIWQEAGI